MLHWLGTSFLPETNKGHLQNYLYFSVVNEIRDTPNQQKKKKIYEIKQKENIWN